MNKTEKLYGKIKNNPKNVRFEEIEQLLLDIGFEERQARGGSSHYIFYHEKLRPVQSNISTDFTDYTDY